MSERVYWSLAQQRMRAQIHGFHSFFLLNVKNPRKKGNSLFIDMAAPGIQNPLSSSTLVPRQQK